MKNYDKLMIDQINEIDDGSKLLLHACCGPCSSAVIERLSSKFLIDILFYNPNITDEIEYYKRLDELKRVVELMPHKYEVNVLDGGFNNSLFFDVTRGHEKDLERGERCYICYNLRLEETARYAEKNNYPFFATTLTLSPYKKVDWLNEIGENLNNKYNTTYLYSDFKKKNGYKRSIEISKELNLYRQDYCGCIYSLRDRQEKRKDGIIDIVVK